MSEKKTKDALSDILEDADDFDAEKVLAEAKENSRKTPEESYEQGKDGDESDELGFSPFDVEFDEA